MRVLHKKMPGPCSFCGAEEVDVRISGAVMTGIKRNIYLCSDCATQLANAICPLPEPNRCDRIVKKLREQKKELSIFMRGELSELLEQAASAIEGFDRKVIVETADAVRQEE